MLYLQGPSPDFESSQAAYEAYFGEPLQAFPDAAQDAQPDSRSNLAAFRLQADSLRNILLQAQATPRLGSNTAVQLALQEHPVFLADTALKDAICIISSQSGQSHIDGHLPLKAEAAVQSDICLLCCSDRTLRAWLPCLCVIIMVRVLHTKQNVES